MAGTDLFSIAAMFIMFRESLEAAVVISVMLQLCSRLRLPQLRYWVWVGALSGLALAVVIGAVIIVLFYVAQTQIFTGDGRNIFEGFMFLIASFLITVLAFAMLRFRGYEQKWEAKLRSAAENQAKNRWGIGLLAFTTTLREGLESVVFLTGVSAGISLKSVPIAGLVGIALGLAVGVVLYYTGRQISDIAWFMYITCGLLFFIGAGLTTHAMEAFQASGWFGYIGQPASAQPWCNRQLWDWSRCCSSDINRNKFFGLVAALFGYEDKGTAIWVLAYFLYWLEVAAVVAAKGARGALLTAGKRPGAGAQPSAIQLQRTATEALPLKAGTASMDTAPSIEPPVKPPALGAAPDSPDGRIAALRAP